MAEGVETLMHATILKGLGCDVLQGYALSRPMDEKSLADFVANWSKRAVSKDVPIATVDGGNSHGLLAG